MLKPTESILGYPGVGVTITAQFHSLKLEFRFHTSSSSTRGVFEVYDGENL